MTENQGDKNLRSRLKRWIKIKQRVFNYALKPYFCKIEIYTPLIFKSLIVRVGCKTKGF